jgi:hypothetical protein
MKSQNRIWIAALSVVMGLGCKPAGEKVAGNGSEVENGISGRVYLPDASPAKGAIVALIPVAYNPFRDTNLVLAKDTTDGNGRFAFRGTPSDSYNLEAVSADREMNALISGVDPDSVILSEPGAINLEKSKLSSADIYIPGSDFHASVDSDAFSWNSVPTGVFDLKYKESPTAFATGIPVGANHESNLPAEIIPANRDAYLESTEPMQNTGGRQYLRLKSGDQGIILLGFDLDSASSLDTATLWMTVSDFQFNFEDYSYSASVYGFTSPWVEGTAYHIEDPDDGSTYAESQPGLPWKAGFPNTSLDTASRLDVSFAGVKGGQQKHPFPISARILNGMKSGAYTGIAIIENSSRYNNVDFSSSEGSHPPELHLYAPRGQAFEYRK